MLGWLNLKNNQIVLCFCGGFLVFLIITVLTVGFALQSDKATLAAVQYQSGQNSLEQVCKSLEISRQRMIDKYLYTFRDSSLRELLTNNVTLNLAKINEYQRCLYQIKNTHSYVDSVGIYFEKNQRILYSDIGIASLSDAAFSEWYYNDSSTEKITPTFLRKTSLPSKKETNIFSVWIKFPIGFSQNFGGALLINIDQAAMAKHLQNEMLYPANSRLYLTDSTQKIIFAPSTEELYQQFTQLPLKQISMPGNDLSGVSLNSKPYLMFHSDSTWDGYTCYILSPAEPFLNTIDQLNHQALLNGGIQLFCGALFFWFAGMLFLAIRKRLDCTLPAYRQALLTNLILTTQPLQKSLEQLQFSNCRLPSNGLFVSVLQVEPTNEAFDFMTQIQGAFGNEASQLFCVSLSETRLVVVSEESHISCEELCGHWKSMSSAIYRQQKRAVFIGVCDTTFAVNELNSAYQRAKKAMHTLVSQNHRGVLCYSNVSVTQYLSEALTKDRIEQLTSLIRLGKTEKACSYYRELHAEVSRQDSPLDTQLFCRQITTAIKNLCTLSNLYPDHSLPNDETPYDTVQGTEELVHRTASSFGQRLQNKKADIYFAQISEYIENNYQKDITVEQVCTHVELSPTYVNKILKLYTNKSLVQYLNDNRIERACELLSCSNMKIKEIGEAVGFSSAKYFIKMFHESRKVTPGEYRKLMENNNRA